MKWVMIAVLVVSSLSLVLVLIRNRYSLEWIRRLALHLILAAIGLYAINYSGLLSGWEIPLNFATIGTVMVLGLPGIALIVGLRYTLF
ncbi:pro-sigmaK processing inhibitor BofA family protein [Paenibacillus kobensis]|uniref:pro-sigmaK processing inhibitor BofA family protein n=1 Tax=Paenibacillus kobensis TaxID=59841 RepID=UPI000FDA9E55|nr:pro-sigmaK processing inhibitor BofA family protein [Paenibacillus kobensis]